MHTQKNQESRSKQEIQGSADSGELTIRRLSGTEPVDDGEPWRSMLAAVARHERETSDPEATFGTKPLSAAEAAAMMDRQYVVSGYRLIKLTEFCEHSEQGLDEMMAASLTEAELDHVEWEAAWALGDRVLIYVRGALRGG